MLKSEYITISPTLHHRSSTIIFLSQNHRSLFPLCITQSLDRIIFLPHSVNLVHHLSPPSYHPSLPLSSISDLKLTCSTNPSHYRSSPTHRTAHWISTGLPSRTPYDSVLCFSFSVILVDVCV